MKRIAIVFGAVSLLLLVDAIYLLATHRNPSGDTGILFGNPHNFLSSGTIVLISALLVSAASVAMWLVAVHREDVERVAKKQPAGDPPTSEQRGPSGRTASAA